VRAGAVVVRVAALVMIVLGVAGKSVAEDHAFKLIVNPDNHIDAVDREFLRDAYLKKTVEWENGEAIRPVNLASHHPVREKFDEQVLRRTPAQLRAYWTQQIFSGKAVPPPEAESVADAVAYVLANKGAVGYVPIDVDAGKARVIGIR
jgi:ABC-type phosphate transport system substrate-binding protein